MDLYCSKCGEPVDNDELHGVAQASGQRYAEVAASFRIEGCHALGMTHNNHPDVATDRVFGLTRAQSSEALYDLLGDDMDGAAAMMEDMGW